MSTIDLPPRRGTGLGLTGQPGVLAYVVRAIEWFVPHEFDRADVDTRRRALLIPTFALIGLVAAVIVGTCALAVGLEREGVVFLGGAVVAGAIPWMLRWTRSLAIAGNFDVLIWWGTLAACAVGTGVGSPAMMASATAPLVATFLVGPRWAWPWVVVVFVQVTTQMAVEVGTSDVAHVVAHGCYSLTFMVAAFVVAVVWEARKDEALRMARRQEGDFRVLIESSMDAVLVHRDDRVLYANAAALDALGYPRPDMVNRRFADLVVLDEPPSVPGAPRILVLRRANGATTTFEATTVDVTYQGEAAHVVVARDVTVRREFEARVAQSDRLASVGTLAAGVAHEINNPLTYILSNLEDATRRLTDPAAADVHALAEPLAEAREGAERIREIVAGMRGLARGEHGMAHAVDVARVVEQALGAIGNEIRHRARLEVRLQPVAAVWIDEGRLAQVCANLLINAVQATSPGRADENVITVVVKPDEAGRPTIQVSDTGVGISAANLPRVFDPFFTTKPVGVGVGIGLGLALCHRFVSEAGGELTVDSHAGVGSTFCVALPGYVATSSPRLPRAALTPRAPTIGGRVLIIDDDPRVGRSLKRSLARAFEVEVTTSARAALAEIVDGKRYDAVLCDLMMPMMTGMEFHLELVRQAPLMAARVLFVTGGAFSTEAIEFVNQHADRCVYKPVDGATLRARLAALIETAAADELAADVDGARASTMMRPGSPRSPG